MKTSRALPAVLVFLGLLISGCSTAATVQSNPSAPAYPSGAASAPVSEPASAPTSTGPTASATELCADAATLKSSISDLASVNVLSGGLSGIQTKVTTIQTNLTALQQSAQGQFGPEISAMRGAVSTLRSGVSAATANPGISTIAAVAKDVAAVVSTYKALDTAVRTTCG
jgi:hypothetical protein